MECILERVLPSSGDCRALACFVRSPERLHLVEGERLALVELGIESFKADQTVLGRSHGEMGLTADKELSTRTSKREVYGLRLDPVGKQRVRRSVGFL